MQLVQTKKRQRALHSGCLEAVTTSALFAPLDLDEASKGSASAITHTKFICSSQKQATAVEMRAIDEMPLLRVLLRGTRTWCTDRSSDHVLLRSLDEASAKTAA